MDLCFSIIIPIYNSEKFLSTCLDSILKQDMDSFEIICINDGSTDNSQIILEEYAKKSSRIKILQQENKGVSSARNAGIKQANGDYILFLDSDDYYYNNHILTDFFNILYEQDYDCIYFPGGCITDQWSGKENYETKVYDNAWYCLEEHCNKPKILIFGCVYTQCYRRKIILENNLQFNENLCYGEDRLFTIRFFAVAYKTYVYSQPCYCYVTHEGSLMTDNQNTRKKIQDAFLVVEVLYNNIQRNTIEYNRYVNALYRTAILDAYNENIKRNLNSEILLCTALKAKSLKRFIKSVMLMTSPKFYKRLFK